MTYDSCWLTIQDKMNESLFFDSNHRTRPALIVEGRDDMMVYSYLLKLSTLGKNAGIDIVLGEGKGNILRYHDEGRLVFDYVILLDADHDRWLDRCRQDEAIVYTHYYSVENYYTSADVIKAAVAEFSNIYTSNDTTRIILMEIYESLKPLHTAVVMKVECEWCIPLEKCGTEAWMDSKKGLIDPRKLATYITDQLEKSGMSPDNPYSAEDLEVIIVGAQGAEVSLTEIDMVVSGKHKLRVAYYRFRCHFPEMMKNRSLDAFKTDLIRNIGRCKEAVNLLDEIESRFERLLGNHHDLLNTLVQ